MIFRRGRSHLQSLGTGSIPVGAINCGQVLRAFFIGSGRQSYEKSVYHDAMIVHQVFALLAAALVASTSVPQTSPQLVAPRATVTSFYQWYFTGKPDWTQLAGARRFLTPSLYSELHHVVEVQQRKGGAVLDFDPFIGAQERAQSYEVLPARGQGTHMSVPVRLSFEHSSANRTTVAILMHGPSGWRIDNFLYPGIGDLRSIVQKALHGS